MSFEVTGKLIAKYDTNKVSDKFQKREFVIELAEEINGNIYTNYAKMQLVQNKCEIIERYKVGDMIKVSFNIKGNSYVDKKDGQTKYITNLDAWRVEMPSAAPAGASSQQYNTPSQASPVYNNSGGNMGNNNFNGAANFNPSPETIDDLPF